MRPKSMILILIALGCGLVASIGISQVVERGSDDGAAQVKTRPIYVATSDIDIGEELNAQRVKLEDWPVDRIPAGAVTTAEQLERQAPKQRLFEGEPILLGKLASVDSLTSASDRIKPGHRAMSVKVTMDTAVSHLIKPGDHVDILAFLRGGRGFAPKAEIVLTNIEIFAINDIMTRDTEEDGRTIQAKTVSLLVTPDQASKLVFFSEQGRLHLTLRNPGEKDEAIPESRPVPLPMPQMPTPTSLVQKFLQGLAPAGGKKVEPVRMRVLDGTGTARVFAWDKHATDALPRELAAVEPEAPKASAASPAAPLPPFLNGTIPGVVAVPGVSSPFAGSTPSPPPTAASAPNSPVSPGEDGTPAGPASSDFRLEELPSLPLEAGF